MHSVVLKRFRKMDWTVMCAAVRTLHPQSLLATRSRKCRLELKTGIHSDILKELGVLKKKGQLLIGFAAETENLEANAKGKLAAKNLDLICVNDLKVAGSDATELILFRSTKDKGKKLHGDKFDVAHGLIDAIKEI
jgi:phosphopantothenoylcysteine decarboxylase/phosphopantothenate--cysteine ligase